MSFPELLLAGFIVAAGIFALDQFSPAAAWLLTILVLLMIALRYPDLSKEFSKAVSVSGTGGNQDPNFDAEAILRSLNNSIPIQSDPP